MGTIGISRGFIKVYLLVSSNMASQPNGGFSSTPCLNIGGTLWQFNIAIENGYL
jgi:hypothetical protein